MTAITSPHPVALAARVRASAYTMSAAEKRFVGWHLLVGALALSIGSFFGPLQALEHAKIDLYRLLQPLIRSYYQGLTLHGVLNALVWTTFFITGFFNVTVTHGLRRKLAVPSLTMIGFILMVLGLLTAAVPIFLNQASHEIGKQYLSSAKSHRLLDWSAQYSIEAGLRRTLNWYREFLSRQR